MAGWLNWIAQGKSLYLDKEKIPTLINQQRTNLADVDYLDLDSEAKVLQNFENPEINEEKLGDKIRFEKVEEEPMREEEIMEREIDKVLEGEKDEEKRVLK